MYVEMSYHMMPGFTRPFWIGTLYAEEPPNLNFEDFRDDLDAWRDAQVFASYNFRLDAITGMRVDVSYMHPTQLRSTMRSSSSHERELVRSISPNEPMTPEEEKAMRQVEFMSKWFEMDIDEQLEFSDLTPERLEAYKQTALELAQKHFNQTTVESIQVGDAWSNSPLFMECIEENEDGGYHIIVSAIAFNALDNTGREAIIKIPTENASWRLVSVGTMHNEFIPGFSYDRDGIG
jgi:hypothetical protein